MKRTARLLAASSGLLLAATLAPTALAAPAAQRVGGGSVSVSSSSTVSVPEDTCIKHPVSYTVTLPDPSKRWGLDLYVYRADGTLSGSTTVGTVTGAPLSGSAEIQFCSYVYPDPTTVTVQSELDYRDETDTPYTNVRGNDVTLNVIGKVKSKIKLAAKKKRGTIKATVKVKAVAGSTSYAVEGGKVVLQKKAGKKWKKVAKAVTNEAGKATLKTKGRGTTTLRATFAGLGEFTAVGTGVPVPKATSRTVTVR